MSSSWARWRDSIVWGVRLYAGVLAVLIGSCVGLGDLSPTLFLLHALLLYAFLPLPLVGLAAIATWRLEPALFFAAGSAVWALFWGELFVPRAVATANGPRFSVLTFNALGFNEQASETVRVICESGADVVALQELNPRAADAVEHELGAVYPYRWLEPRSGFVGAGILSRYPFRRVEPVPSADWASRPLAVELDIAGRRVTFVRFHAASGASRLRQRDRQARALAAFARRHEGPLVLAGDLNATDQNHAYALLATELRDAWREAGWGFGHTFPGPPTRQEGGSRPVVLGLPVPQWLIRLDYVWHSPELVALDARLAPRSAASDHRGVVATLALR